MKPALLSTHNAYYGHSGVLYVASWRAIRQVELPALPRRKTTKTAHAERAIVYPRSPGAGVDDSPSIFNVSAA